MSRNGWSMKKANANDDNGWAERVSNAQQLKSDCVVEMIQCGDIVPPKVKMQYITVTRNR